MATYQCPDCGLIITDTRGTRRACDQGEPARHWSAVANLPDRSSGDYQRRQLVRIAS